MALVGSNSMPLRGVMLELNNLGQHVALSALSEVFKKALDPQYGNSFTRSFAVGRCGGPPGGV
jgi:hypothetical protein